MKTMLATGGVLMALSAGWGCDTTPATDSALAGESIPPASAQSTVRAMAIPEAAPMDLSGSVDSNWSYLAKKYDADGDGQIMPAEYARSGGQFERLDQDEDGAITADDFQRGGGMGMDPARMRMMVAQQLMMMYFQNDEEEDTLSLAELEQAIDGYDANGDGSLTGAEFTGSAEHRLEYGQKGNPRMMRMMMQDKTPWEALVEGLDKDANQEVGKDEVVAFFKDRDDGDLVWSMGGRRQARGGQSPQSSEGRQEPEDGAMEGAMAPDFTLSRLHSDEQVSLSSFRNNLPVALIFGSYT